ncbi:DUF2892 domain-containing protein [Aurantibacter sp.]|uniref:YgaP family membrane protein n=1 Tax=Aurantibacter sp. TaxID=2807103 RepID=UPI003266135F
MALFLSLKKSILNLNLNMMKKNMGKTDRIVRIILAAIIGVLYFTNIITGTLGLVLLLASVIFIFTSVISFCPLYTIFGLNTCPIESKK